MNKTAIKNFAVEARKKLIASVIDKAGLLGITKEEIKKPEAKGEGFEVYKTHAGTENTIYSEQIKYRASLVNKINEKGFQNVVEEVAYTWFNRIIAVRFMEVNDYLPSRVRVLSSETDGKNEPDIVTLAPKIDLEFKDNEIETIIKLKEENKSDELFQLLFIKQCNELGQILPELFEQTSDYTEMLLNISFINEDGIIRDLMKIDEADFLEAVEIIGWMYQYYNTEPKDETFALLKKNVKITKERIPAATQLFTPDWIVRYMVENSLGRLANEELGIKKDSWKYYLDGAEQNEEVEKQLEKCKLNIKSPEEIKVIDPCMGSGHILVYAFDVLMDIYTSCGYAERDSVKLILENNLYGLDIDDRAYQLAYFAVMMKARKYNRRILNEGIKLNLHSIQESNGKKAEFKMQKPQLSMDDMVFETANYLIDIFKDAKEYGSIINVEQRNYEALERYIEKIAS
jgi:hypothetical protein